MPTPDSLLDEQKAYYRAIAREYEDHALPPLGADEVTAAVDAFAASGRVLELACGPGTWTRRLAATADHLTAVDASPEMLARARQAVDAVRFVEADLFTWQPDGPYDAVFSAFWISHVPVERFAAFWARVGDALAPGGRVFFVDDAFRAPEELIEGPASATVQRRLTDGTPFRAVKVPWEPAALEHTLRALGWDIRVRGTRGPFYWGVGQLA